MKLGPRELLDLVAEKASALRAAGVQTITIGTLSFSLSPYEPPPVAGSGAASEDENSDPLFDPATYAGRMVPGRARPSSDDGVEDGS